MAKYITCDDSNEDINKYEISIDNVATQVPASSGATPGSKHIWFDLTPVAEGTHSVKARAGNDWGWSDWTPDLPFTKVLPSIPSGLELVVG